MPVASCTSWIWRRVDERPTEEASDGLRQSRGWASGAWLLLATSLWLAWWRITFHDPLGNRTDRIDQSPWNHDGVYVVAAATWVTIGLVVAALALLFVRIAGRSWLYEPAAWRRDVALAAGCGGAALASAWWWPAGDPVAPRFWGGVTFELNGTAGDFAVQAGPGLGWWTAALAVACLGIALWRAALGPRA